MSTEAEPSPGSAPGGAAEVARRYHERTVHAPTRVAGAGWRRDPSNRPEPHKAYPDLDPEPLPGWEDPAVPAVAALGRTQSGDGAVDRSALARLLFLSGGVTRRISRAGRTVDFRAAPSAGALYPIELYVLCGDLDGLAAGTHHYHAGEHALRRVRGGDARGTLARIVADEAVAARPASLVLTTIPWRTTWKYGLRGWRHVFWDAGTILANTLLAAASAGIAARVLTGFVDGDLDRLLGLDAAPFVERSVAVVPLGDPRAAAPGQDRPDDGVPGAAPLARRERLPDGLLEVHEAGALETPDEVAAWRSAASLGAERPSATGEAPSVADRELSTDALVLRRGSTRRFDPDASIAGEVLRWAMEVAAASPPFDVGAPLSHGLTAHAVRGVPPGAYLWAGGGLDPVRVAHDTEHVRRSAAHVCLDQPHGGTSAFTAYHLADLERALATGGARAYRVAQLAGGVAAGRLQLAAFACGHGGTGLTFYDDEVRRLLATDAAPMLVSAVGEPAYHTVPGRRPGA